MKTISSNDRERACLVIGGGGYIGSFLVPLLMNSGRHVTVLGRSRIPESGLVKGAHYVQGCFSDLALIRRLLNEHHEVIHLAYATVPNTSFKCPLDDLLENLRPAVQLFVEAARLKNRVVLISSGGTVYGEALTLPISEDHSTIPISPYGVTKLTLERYAKLFSVIHGLQVICLRPSNAYGEGQRPFMGQGFVATAMAAAILGRPITVFGESGGIRDYIYVEDLASGIVAALDKGKPGETYNLGSGMGISSIDLLDWMAPLFLKCGHRVHLNRMDPRPFDVKQNVLDISKMKIQLDWAPAIALEVGLARTMEWMLNHLQQNSAQLDNLQKNHLKPD